ncbi:hypothetical protein CSC28_2251 [Pseudomonas paraeruginosa]|nr:hypothetical protein CSC28_2251 [Pseudomonas paraeruginosa]
MHGSAHGDSCNGRKYRPPSLSGRRRRYRTVKQSLNRPPRLQ